MGDGGVPAHDPGGDGTTGPRASRRVLRDVGQVLAAVALVVGGVVVGWWAVSAALESDLPGVGLLVVLAVCGVGAVLGRRRWWTFAPAIGALIGAGAGAALLLVLVWALQGL